MGVVVVVVVKGRLDHQQIISQQFAWLDNKLTAATATQKRLLGIHVYKT